MRVLAGVLCALCLVAAPAHADLLYGTDGTVLHRFDSDFLGTSNPVAITGLALGETLRGIDVRPANGELYGLGSSDAIYTIDPITGAAAAVAPGGPLAGTAFGLSFDPADSLVVASNADILRRYDPQNGTVLAPDATLTGTANVVAIGHHPGGTLFGIDSAAGTLVEINAVSGAVTTIGPLDPPPANPDLALPLSETVGFDITPIGAAFASIVDPASDNRLYGIDTGSGQPTSGNATGLGRISETAPPFVSITGAADDTVGFAGTPAATAEGGTASLTVRRTAATAAGSPAGRATVTWTVTAGTEHVTATTGAVTWNDLDATDKTIAIPLVDDATDEADGAITVALGNPKGSVSLGADVTRTVTVSDNDDPPVGAPPPSAPPPAPPVQTPSATPPPPNRAPRLTVRRLASKKLRDLTSARGIFRVSVTSNEACRLTAELRIPRATAKRLKIGTRIARSQAQLRANRQTSVRLRPAAQIRTKLRRLRSVKAEVWLTCADSAGAAEQPKRAATTLRR